MLLSSISLALTRLGQQLGRWSPLALWPDGIATPGMWISPRDLTSQWADYTGTTPVATPGTVADSSNPVGLALDIRAGAPEVLGPELVVNGDFSDGSTGWTLEGGWTVSGGQASITSAPTVYIIYQTGLTPGKTYLASFTISSISAGRLSFYCGGSFFSSYVTTAGTHTAILVCGATGFLGVQVVDAGTTASVDNISFKEVPGNHMLQSTSAARPLLSARVNALLLKSPYPFDASDDMTDAAVVDATVVNAAGTNTITCGAAADVLVRIGKTNPISPGVTQIFPAGAPFTYSFDVVGVGGAVGKKVCFAAERAGGPNASEEITLSAVTQRVSAVMPAGASPSDIYAYIALKGVGTTANLATGDEIEVTDIQLNIGSDADEYQYADTTALYPSGAPIAQLYDGVDDGMATAAFAAGTLIDGMDCLIPVRRDSAASCVAGLYNGVADATKFFGMAESASGSGCVGSGAGTPTVWVDNTQLTGGTAVTRGTLHTALTVGDWHILEFRNLDLSTWTAAGFGLYTSYVFPGPRGDIMFYPSTASTEDKDAARQWLADYYGVTLS